MYIMWYELKFSNIVKAGKEVALQHNQGSNRTENVLVKICKSRFT